MTRTRYRSTVRLATGALLALSALTVCLSAPTPAMADADHGRSCRDAPDPGSTVPGLPHLYQESASSRVVGNVLHWNNTGSEGPLPICR